MPKILIIAHNIRSTHNIGAIFRTCEGFGVSKIILSGYSPYPKITNDKRLPHIADKLSSQIHKTALGAENMVSFEYQETPNFEEIKKQGFKIVGLEQNERSIALNKYEKSENIALILGEEVHGIPADLLKQCDDIIEIPMFGEKESFNVSVAAGIALYALTI
ncbi:MAG: TrmH family RNA methyltransferase [Candidatus Saccharimonadaceae bacterium]|nr:TrmH family RNA methyltransferase [Candidatus Saccharimonadaceae bacterium]